MLRWILIFLDDIKRKGIVRFCPSDWWNFVHRRNYRLLGLSRHVATSLLSYLLWILSAVTFCLGSLLCWHRTYSLRFLIIWQITCDLGFGLYFLVAWLLRLLLSFSLRLLRSLHLACSLRFLSCRFCLCLINLLRKCDQLLLITWIEKVIKTYSECFKSPLLVLWTLFEIMIRFMNWAIKLIWVRHNMGTIIWISTPMDRIFWMQFIEVTFFETLLSLSSFISNCSKVNAVIKLVVFWWKHISNLAIRSLEL